MFMCNRKITNITPDELRTKLTEKSADITDKELSAIVEAIEELNHEKSEDGLFTLLSFQWKTRKNRYVKITIPW